jgi:hypothetical protein
MENESSHPELSLEERTLEYLEKNGTTSVRQLRDALRTNDPSLTESEVTTMVWRLSEQGKAILEEVWPVTRSFVRFLGLWERHLSLYVSLVVALATILSIYVVPPDSPWGAIRLVLGLVFVLFIPGYVTVEALFPKSSEFDSLERFALSVGLSIAIVMFVGLVLNYTPWGIRLTPIVISLTIVSLGLVLASLVRGYFQQDLTSFS